MDTCEEDGTFFFKTIFFEFYSFILQILGLDLFNSKCVCVYFWCTWFGGRGFFAYGFLPMDGPGCRSTISWKGYPFSKELLLNLCKKSVKHTCEFIFGTSILFS